MSIILDAGALIAIEKRNRAVGATLELARRRQIPIRTSAGAVAQVWRGGPRQANLARVLAGVRTVALDLSAARHIGALKADDVVDAHVALLVHEDDQVLTSDPDDIRRLLRRRQVRATVVRT
jgi:hypothetical protein